MPTAVQCWPPSCVAYSWGPNAQPSSVLRNRIWLTPDAPSGAPAAGAGTPYQLRPALSVRATDVQYWVAHRWPGTPAWPMTQPVCRPTNVAEVAAKSAGTGGGAAGASAGPALCAAGSGLPDVPSAPCPAAGRGAGDLAAAPLAVGFWFTFSTDVASRGTTMTAAATAAAAAAVTAAWR